MNVVTTTQGTGLATLGATNTILGERMVSIPIGGKIRPGTMVPTKKAAENPNVRAIYEKGVAAGKPFDEIEKEIAQTGYQGSPLTPKNIPFFVVRGADFSMPEIADRIMELYGEDRGDGKRRLYRFPVIFPVDAWQAVLPHAMKCYTASELRFWSEYDPNGTRYCKTRAQVPIDQRSKRAIRVFGGRPVVIRDLCDPENCQEYQTRKCNLSGSLVFFVPGIPGTGAIEIPTNSFYAMNNARQKLEMVAFMRGGRISGLNNGKPIFWITKKQHELSTVDPETGRPKKVKQWLIEIDADLDVSKLLRESEDDGTELATIADHAQQILTGDAATPVEPDPSTPVSGEVLPPETPAAPSSQTPPSSPPLVSRSAEQELKDLRKVVFDVLTELDIETTAYDLFASQKWGHGWGKRIESIRDAAKALEQVVVKRKLVAEQLDALAIDFTAFASYARGKWGKTWSFDPVAIDVVAAELEAAFEYPEDYAASIADRSLV